MSKELYENLFLNHPEATLVLDLEYKVESINNKFINNYGYHLKEIKGKHIAEIINSDSKTCPICNNINAYNIKEEEQVHTAKVIDINSNEIPVKITHVKTNSKYITVVSPLSEMICLNQLHMDFVSTVSHELRTPLTSIKGFADTLLTAGDKLDKDQQKRFISIIKNQIDRLTRLVENLLTVSRLESKKEKTVIKTLNFKSFIETIILSLEHKAKNHIIDIKISDNLLPLLADEDKLEQVFINLIDNAIKYSYPKSKILITAKNNTKKENYIKIDVSDEGVGIPEEYINNIFTKFARIDNPLTREVQGTGLGLYITKSLIESMDGEISAKSNNKGTIFSVLLPTSNYQKQSEIKYLEGNV